MEIKELQEEIERLKKELKKAKQEANYWLKRYLDCEKNGK